MDRRAGISRCLMGRIEHGKDLLDELTALCLQEHVTLGQVTAIGAMQKARVGYYNQKTRQYEYLEWNEEVELLGLIGNVSIRDGKPAVHAHVTLADRKGNAFGGHLVQGTIVFACEYSLVILEGPELTRRPDSTTGLPLWTE